MDLMQRPELSDARPRVTWERESLPHVGPTDIDGDNQEVNPQGFGGYDNLKRRGWLIPR